MENYSVKAFADYLVQNEKSQNTIEKYTRDVRAFLLYLGENDLSKERLISFKQYLIDRGLAVRSINSMIASVHAFLLFCGREDCKIKIIKIQREIFRPEERELSKDDYYAMCVSAENQNDDTFSLLLQTLCGTGIRVGELSYITVEAVKKGMAWVCSKGKNRKIFIVKKLQQKLLRYCREKKIYYGVIFKSRNGKVYNRSTVWRKMQAVSKIARVNPKKSFPHNLRHLFAQVFYQMEKDIVKLADILGHSNINTTRIYVMGTGEEHRERMEKMNLIIPERKKKPKSPSVGIT